MVLWYFWIYSFLGYLLERAFAAVTHAEHQGRRCFLLLPLCPVYGLGMLAVLALPPDWTEGGWLVISGGLAATAVEYAVSVFYQQAFSVSFWDYHGQIGNLNGRVCLPFTLAWGLLLLPMVYWVHPAAARLFAVIPTPVSWAALAAFTADGIVSSVILRRTGDRTRLRWRRAVRRPQ